MGALTVGIGAVTANANVEVGEHYTAERLDLKLKKAF